MAGWHASDLFRAAELLEKLAAMIPKPRLNLLVYHGAFAPHAERRTPRSSLLPRRSQLPKRVPLALSGCDAGA